MCGIAGFYNCSAAENIPAEISIKKMLSVIRHRGPDETGIYLADNLTMGSVRLSIIDIASGQQPVSDQSGNFWIVYNGEIFNYPELKATIEKQGIHLKTNCDTEVLVQLYALYGADCLKYLNGQFSFCIWDKAKKEMFLARDRAGIRPLFYWNRNGGFAFCSEIKGLFTLQQIEKKISTESLAQVFTFWTTLTPHTPFENIFELSPGHYMTVKNGEVKIQQYWSLEFPSAQNTHHNNLNRSVEEFTELIKDATSIRLRADVPVAAYLSGGLDSSVTTSLINEINPGNLKTFSIGFKDKEFDETAYQQEAANYFNTKHTAFECTAAEIADAFATTIWHTEFPLLRTSPTPMYLLSKKVRENNIKVVITGEGADEVLAGYNIYKEAKIRRFWANQPNSSFRPKLLSKLYPYIPMIKGSNNLALKMFFGYKLAETADPLYSHLLRWHNTSRIKTYFSDDITESLNSYNPVEKVYGQLPENFETWSGLAKSQYLESVIFMSGYLLSSQGDRVAMANSVEGRYPFLDYRVIEFCAGLPDSFKLNCLNEKFVLKKMSKGRIPESITKRSKQAYRAPIASSFFYSGAPEYISDILSEHNLKAFGIFNPEKVNALITKIKTNQNISEMDQMAIAGILSTQLLQKMFIEEVIPTDIESLQNFKIIKE